MSFSIEDEVTYVALRGRNREPVRQKCIEKEEEKKEEAVENESRSDQLC